MTSLTPNQREVGRPFARVREYPGFSKAARKSTLNPPRKTPSELMRASRPRQTGGSVARPLYYGLKRGERPPKNKPATDALIIATLTPKS